MARYTGPKSKISRKYGEPIFGDTKALEKKPHPPGQHGRGRRRKKSEYAIQLAEKQKAKYLYGCLLYTSPSPRDRTRSRMPSSA